MSESNSKKLPELNNLNDSNLLGTIGRAYFGNSWKKSMAIALNVDERRITHWLQSTRPVPTGVWADLIQIGKERLAEITVVENLAQAKIKSLTDI
ncbi:hypothetical protein [Acinetobacter oleivorans]